MNLSILLSIAAIYMAAIVHLLFAVAFIWAGRRSMSAKAAGPGPAASRG